jgi:hypothetical protein
MTELEAGHEPHFKLPVLLVPVTLWHLFPSILPPCPIAADQCPISKFPSKPLTKQNLSVVHPTLTLSTTTIFFFLYLSYRLLSSLICIFSLKFIEQHHQHGQGMFACLSFTRSSSTPQTALTAHCYTSTIEATC